MTVNLGLGAGWEKANPSNLRKENPKTHPHKTRVGHPKGKKETPRPRFQKTEPGAPFVFLNALVFGMVGSSSRRRRQAWIFWLRQLGCRMGDLVVGLGWALKREQGSRTPKGRNYLGGGVFVLV
jgi:hypothetical protein